MTGGYTRWRHRPGNLAAPVSSNHTTPRMGRKGFTEMTETVAEYRHGSRVQIGVETARSHVSTACFVEDETELSYRAYPCEERLTFAIGTSGGEVTLFTRGPALDRLIFALVAARNHLQSEAVKIHRDLDDAPIDLYPVDDK